MIRAYTLAENTKWDEIVRSFTEYDIYWLSGYVRAFQIHGDGEPLLFYYEGEHTRGITVVMKRDIAKDEKFHGKLPLCEYYDLSTPYGYGGWLIEGDDCINLFEEYSAFLNKFHIISEFVRFHPMLRNHCKCEDFYHIIQLGEVIHMNLGSPEIIWDNITSKNRNMIRKAVKNNIKVYNGRYPHIYKEFREIYNETMDKDEAERYYYFDQNFYESILEDLPDNSQIFYAEKDGVVIAASIMLMANGRMNYHLSGSLSEARSLAPTNLILYKAALWGCANGYKTLYLGGGVGSGEDSLFKFKRAFYRGDLNHFYIGQKIYDQEKYDELLRVRNCILSDIKYFPQYRG